MNVVPIRRSRTGFLTEMALVEADGSLSQDGVEYFRGRFIVDDGETSRAVLQRGLTRYGPAVAICQMLFGVPDADRRKAEAVLRHHGFGDGLNARSLGTLLVLLHRAGLINYHQKTGALRVYVSLRDELPDASMPTASVFVSPQTPFGNRVALKRVLGSLKGDIRWLDKHFMPGALEVIWEAVVGDSVSSFRILSLPLPENESRKTKRDYRALRNELKGRGIDLAWRAIDSQLIKSTHDRWIIGDNAAWNVPNVNAILSGQNSELVQSSNRDEAARVFEDYWARGVELAPLAEAAPD